MNKTSIQWTDLSINPIAAYHKETGKRGWFCVHASTGCVNCYAESLNTFRGNGLQYRAPNRKKVEFKIVPKILAEPIALKKPHRIFPCSMTDLFLEDHDDALIDMVFCMMAIAKQHTFQVLTKRAARMRQYLSDPWRLENIYEIWSGLSGSPPEVDSWPLKNVWLGVSGENQEMFDERVVTAFMGLPAGVVRWVSIEPQIADIDIEACGVSADWYVVGGESGAKARPFSTTWPRRIIRQAHAMGASVFVKQLGRRPYEGVDASSGAGEGIPFNPIVLKDGHGGDWDEWPEDLRVREFPKIRAPGPLVSSLGTRAR